MGLPLVQTLILSWNRKQDTIEVIHSLLESDYSSKHIITVDNDSSDGVVSALRKEFPQITVIENSQNLGFAEGNNVGIRYALEQNADYIFLLNNDAIVEPGCLKRLLDVAEANHEIGMVCPTVVSHFNRSITYLGGKIHWAIAAGEEIERSPEGLPEIVDVDYAPGCALLVKTKVIRRIGLLDPRYFAYFEDTDWSARCHQAGYRVVAVPKARVVHKGTMDAGVLKSPLAIFLYRRNQILFVRKHGRWTHWLSFLKHYIRKSLEQCNNYLQSGELDKANAVIDGCWAGLSGHYGSEFVTAPKWLHRQIKSHMPILLWLTGWLYYWDYQKKKRAKANGFRAGSQA